MTTSIFSPIGLEDRLRAIAQGRLSIEASIRETTERADALDGELKAFVRRAAQNAASAHGPFAGIAMGIKDTFETADMATEHGSPIHAGHQPRGDASLVAMARGKGAFIAGKTATAELAGLTPAATRNPHDLRSTPGGSSSGSAAGVAAGFVVAALGSQTGGSVIRPAAFCGVCGYKPSFRLLPTVGMKTYAWSLDTAGLFTRGVRDAALLAQILTGRELAIDDTQTAARLRVGIYRAAIDDRLEPAMVEAVQTAARLLERAGAVLSDIAEPAVLSLAREAQLVIQDFEGALALAHERLAARDLLSDPLRQALDRGAAIAPQEYDEARRRARAGRRAATTLFDEVDVVLAPSANGAAPASLATTGDPAMNRLWTLTGNPCVNVPGLFGGEGMPVGISIIARFGRDRLALEAAAMLQTAIDSDQAT